MRVIWKNLKLTKEEQAIEDAIGRGEYVNGSRKEFKEIARALARHRKNVVLNVRINQGDLDALKARAKRRGIKYQTFIAEVLHRVAHS